jgi:hypothetical protein
MSEPTSLWVCDECELIGSGMEAARHADATDHPIRQLPAEIRDAIHAALDPTQPIPSCLSEEGVREKLLGEIEHQRRCVSFAESSAIHAGAGGNQAGEKEARLSAAIHKVTAESLEALLPKGTK